MPGTAGWPAWRWLTTTGTDRTGRPGAVMPGQLDSALVSVNPYLRYALTERLSVWGALGYGQGTLRLRPERDATVPQESIETGMEMGMGALGLRGTVYASERTELVLKSDALWVRTSSEDAPGMRAVDNADTSRIRLLLSGRHQRSPGQRCAAHTQLRTGTAL